MPPLVSIKQEQLVKLICKMIFKICTTTHWDVNHSRKAIKILGTDRLDQLRVNGYNGWSYAFIEPVGFGAKLLEFS